MTDVVFLWHMHQPYYVNPVTRTAMMPWVRLHSVKGYLDMISIIEDYPGVRVNFNLTPVLLLQICELVDGEITDLWLEWSRKPAAELEEADRFSILENFFKINWDNMIKPYPRYWELLNKRGMTFYGDEVRRGLRYFTTQEFLDLQVWFNLAWCGYTAFRMYPELEELRRKGRHFTEEEKARVLDIHLEIMRLVIRKYGEAEARGQAELTTTPFYHPILPLVYDSAFAERCLPGRRFPQRFHWPQDAEAHLKMAVAQHEKLFGRKPRGLWPSEGSIAPELIPLMRQVGIEYFCSDEENLFNSIRRDPAYQHQFVDHLELFQGWRVVFDGSAVNAVFREKPLSDFIGFMAAKNEPDRAAMHLMHHLRHINDHVQHDGGLIPLILDGENAWETFRDGGEAFLRHLYGSLQQESGRLCCRTIEDYFRAHPPRRQLATLHTGSWISSNFDIWIGEPEENDGWDRLGETRQFLQDEIDEGRLSKSQREAALREIYAAEGSDWFWWYGPDFQTDCDVLFDDLFRQHLKNVYVICGKEPPAELDRPIIRAKVVQPYRMPTQLISPEITGELVSYFEWLGAGLYEAGSEQGAMFRSDRILDRFYFGFDEESLYLRLDLTKKQPVVVELHFSDPADVSATSTELYSARKPGFTLKTSGRPVKRNTIAAGSIIEWAIALEDLELSAGDPVGFQVLIVKDGIERERYPESGPVKLSVPLPEFAMQSWVV